jgi:hypothetical protein
LKKSQKRAGRVAQVVGPEFKPSFEKKCDEYKSVSVFSMYVIYELYIIVIGPNFFQIG